MHHPTKGGKQYQPRYIAYAAAHGMSPEQMLAADAQRYVGGKMAGFLIWMNQQWHAWAKANGRDRHAPKTAADHASFDAFLAREVA